MNLKHIFPLLFDQKMYNSCLFNLYTSSCFTNILIRRIVSQNFKRSFQFDSKNMGKERLYYLFKA